MAFLKKDANPFQVKPLVSIIIVLIRKSSLREIIISRGIDTQVDAVQAGISYSAAEAEGD